jgi:hypothetical protein
LNDNPSGLRPFGITALSLFFLAGAIMAAMAALSLAFPGCPLKPMWRVNPRGHQGLVGMGGWGIVGMAVVSLGCAGAAVGLWLRRPWGLVLAIVILVVQLGGDFLNVLSGTEPRAIIGVPIAAALLIYLSKASIRSAFRHQTHEAGK